nr:MAG TPA: lysozyme [Caudoviricetes sp.]DAS01393.1 MAG TPA: lysozyme [Caudoviricetes sp.]DAY42082.1 MAG TPA: lysozyme [Caudoviricetes sp.]
MILGTKPGDVLGDISFGIDISQYLFSMSYDKE